MRGSHIHAAWSSVALGVHGRTVSTNASRVATVLSPASRPSGFIHGNATNFQGRALMSKIRLAKTHGLHSHSGPCWPGTHAVNSNHALSFPKAQPAS